MAGVAHPNLPHEPSDRPWSRSGSGAASVTSDGCSALLLMLVQTSGGAGALGRYHGRGRLPVYRSQQRVGGVPRLAGGRKGAHPPTGPGSAFGGAAPSQTFPVLSSAVCVIRGMELWYACTIDGDVRIDKLYLFARIVRQPEGVARTIRATQEGHRRVAPPPGGARTVAVALHPRVFLLLLRHDGASVTPAASLAFLRGVGGRVRPRLHPGMPIGPETGLTPSGLVRATTPGKREPPGS
jgi:hypothetical protein